MIVLSVNLKITPHVLTSITHVTKTITEKIDDSLSDFEKKVLKHYKNGESYAEIAEKLQSKVKSVDTAIQRIRKKALKIKQKIEEGDK